MGFGHTLDGIKPDLRPAAIGEAWLSRRLGRKRLFVQILARRVDKIILPLLPDLES